MSRSHRSRPPHGFCGIVPPHVLKELLLRGDDAQRGAAFETLRATEAFRGRRHALAAAQAGAPAGELRRTIFDAQHRQRLPGTRVRSEGGAATKDVDVNEAYDGLGATYAFLEQVLGRKSIDDAGMRLDATVHFGTKYDNAFWNGTQMVFGDGDGVLFRRFTSCLEVIAHELTHGVIQHEADLAYSDQSGALNESFADVFGVLVKQHALGQTVDQASWLVGEGLLAERFRGQALRSMKAPGTAYDNDVIGKDPQPAHMSHYIQTDEDDGGVHLNSGIPNRAFYLAARGFEGYAWEKAGRIWYRALTQELSRRASFADAARATMIAASALFGKDAERIVEHAWREVGVKPAEAMVAAA